MRKPGTPGLASVCVYVHFPVSLKKSERKTSLCQSSHSDQYLCLYIRLLFRLHQYSIKDKLTNSRWPL